MPLRIDGGTFGKWGAYIGDVERYMNQNVTQSVLEEAAQPILDQMRANASHDPSPRSGALRSSINIGKAGHQGGSGSGRVGITIGVHRNDWTAEDYYPAYVEYGHAGPHGGKSTAPHPFIRPAVNAKSEEALNILIDRLKTIFD